MKIALVASVEKADKAIKIVEEMEKLGIDVEIPYTIGKIRGGEINLKEFKKYKKEHGGDIHWRRQAKIDYIGRYFEKIKKSDGILVLNFTKNNIKNYIGGNALIEIAFAHVLKKPIYLFNPVPKMSYTDEILDMKPITINGKLGEIK